MARRVLDTNIVSYMMKGKPEAELYRTHLQGHTLCISFITVGELYAGAEKAQWGQTRRNQLEEQLARFIVLPYDVEVARRFGEIRGNLARTGQPIEDHDVWIAATALAYQCPLVTHNLRHFNRIPELILISENL